MKSSLRKGSLRDKFLALLEEEGKQSFSFGEALRWYSVFKTGDKPAYRANVYSAIINPLLFERKIRKEGGHYVVGPVKVDEVDKINEVDEFDSYLKARLVHKGDELR